MSTPNYFTKTMAAGARSEVHGSARFLTIYSSTPGVGVQFGFGDDALQTLAGPLTIDFGALGPGERFSRVVFRDTDALLPATVTGYWSNVLIQGAFSDLTTLVAIQALLTTIDADTGAIATDIGQVETLLEIPDAPTLFALTAVAQTGVGSTQIITAAAGNRKTLIQADHDNGTDVFLGWTNAVTAANSFARLLPGDSWQETHACNVWACGTAGGEEVRGYVIAIA